MRHAYAALDTWIAPAKSRAELWRLGIGVLLFGVFYVALNTALFRFIATRAPALSRDILGASGVGPGATPVSMLVILFSFALIVVSVGMVLGVVHRRPLWSVLGPARLAVRQFSAVVFLLGVVGAVLLVLPPYGLGIDLIQPRPVGAWLALLPIGMIAVLIQTSAEEVLFRGYLQQQLAARFRSPLVWMAIPSALFAAGHYTPQIAGDNAWLVTLWAGVFGLLMADLTARAGSLGPAMAVHFANNLSALLFISLPDSLSGLSLYILPVSMSDTEFTRAWLPVDFAAMLVFWLTARLAIRR